MVIDIILKILIGLLCLYLLGCPANKNILYYPITLSDRQISDSEFALLGGAELFKSLDLKKVDDGFYKGCIEGENVKTHLSIGVCKSQNSIFVFAEYPDLGTKVENYRSEELVSHMNGFNEYEALGIIKDRVSTFLKAKEISYKIQDEVVVTRPEFVEITRIYGH